MEVKKLPKRDKKSLKEVKNYRVIIGALTVIKEKLQEINQAAVPYLLILYFDIVLKMSVLGGYKKSAKFFLCIFYENRI